MPGKQVTELDALPSFTDTSLLPVHNGAGLKKGELSQLANYLGTKFSNPNLLINPDFKINQRGKSSYTSGYSVDRWKISSATLNASTLVVVNNNGVSGALVQFLENKPTGTFTVTLKASRISGTIKFGWKDGDTYKTGGAISNGVNTYTFTASSLTYVGIELASGASAQLDYMKLEQGSVATSFIAPNMAEEILKCQRFYVVLESSLAGYGANNAIYIPFSRGAYMRNSRNVIFTGDNKQTFLRVNGTGKQISFNTANGYANNQYVRVYTNPVDTSLNNTAIGVDLNDTTISVDAEIY